MKTRSDVDVYKAGAGFFGLIFTVLLTLVVTAVFISAPANARGFYRAPALSDALEANGFGTLKFALDTTELTQVLDSNRVTLFAPTDDVFDNTAEALGCTDAMDLATRLLNTPVDGSNALTAILTYHAALGVIRTNYGLLDASPIQTVNTEEVTTGVNSDGLYVRGVANSADSSITATGIRGFRWTIFPIDQILLPFAPPGDLCA